jgi:2-keto-4-pentenoate hydratase/2-oxohepta-3-ene-1,7-dioic acid hydratase in catechol pathway
VTTATGRELDSADRRDRPHVDDRPAAPGDWDAALPRLTELAGRRQGSWLDAGELRVLPPAEPRNLLQSGANYRKHVIDIIASEHDPSDGRTAQEVRADAAAFMEHRAASTDPYLFIGLPSAMCGAFDDIVLPADGTEHDWELELAAVIGRPARRVPPEQSLAHVAAYTIGNDVTKRDLVYRPELRKIGTDWLRSKNAPTFLPTGPVLVPSAFAGDPMDLRITLSVNGQVMQDESTKDRIFDVPRLVSYASHTVRLEPGDLILTGSPAGNGARWDGSCATAIALTRRSPGSAGSATAVSANQPTVSPFPGRRRGTLPVAHGGSGQLEQQPDQVVGPVAGNHVAGGDLPVAPGGRAPSPVGGVPERPARLGPGLTGRLDVGARERAVLQRARQPDRLGEAADRLRRAPYAGPRRLRRVVELAGPRRHQPVAAQLDHAAAGPSAGGVDPVAVTGHERVEVDQVPDPVTDVLQRPGDHEPAVGEAEQDDVAQVLVPDGVDHVGDVGGQADLGTGEVGALTDAGQARCEDLMAGPPQRTAYLAEAVRAAPRAVNQDKDRHRSGPIPDG